MESIAYTLDKQEILILRELIRNPRISDNQIGKRSGIPVKSVNRKRKKLEEKGILNYTTHADHSEEGTGLLPARQMHIIKFREGITRKSGIEAFMREPAHQTMTRHFQHSWFGELQGRLVLVYILESYQAKDLLEIFNAEIVPWIHRHFGDKSITDIQVMDLTADLRIFHNYIPKVNLARGIIKDGWPNQNIFTN